jgi:hypothetical protein
MTDNEAIARLCCLVTEVGQKVYHSKEIHSCFCPDNMIIGSSIVSTAIIEYIEAAVHTAILSQSHNEGD